MDLENFRMLVHEMAYIATKNVGGNGLKLKMKYIMVRLEKMIKNTCTRGVTVYRIFYGTTVLYE